MSGVKLTEQLARRVVKATREVERWTSPAPTRDNRRLPIEPAPLWKNNSGETAPEWAAFEVTDVDIVGGRLVLVGTKPTASAGKPLLFNYRVEVPAGETGVYQSGPVVRARYSSGTGANGVYYAPANNSWQLTTGQLFVSLGKIDDVASDMLVMAYGLTDTFFPTLMSQSGGSAGTQTTQCSWTYAVTDLEGNSLATNHSPTTSPSKWVRPGAGRLSAATAGMARFNESGQLSTYWCNEQINGAPCG